LPPLLLLPWQDLLLLLLQPLQPLLLQELPC
jgi:hypothetical protein